MKTRIVKFPAARSIGLLSVRQKPDDEWTNFASARGNVIVPDGKELRLEVSPKAIFDPRVFADFEPNALSVLEWVSTRQVNDSTVGFLQHLTGLKGLALWETKVGDLAMVSLARLQNLEWLDLGDTLITDDGLRYLLELRSLHYLSLLNTQVTDEGLRFVKRIVSLEGLDLMNTLITDEAIKHLRVLPKLRTLRITQTRISQLGYRKLSLALPHCNVRYHDPHRITSTTWTRL